MVCFSNQVSFRVYITSQFISILSLWYLKMYPQKEAISLTTPLKINMGGT